ncbi:MAG: N-acetylmuramoyl-L-alanine amidase family protein [Actinomycetaceae bacterium]|nr:N-acetylmuramoyl-L-alanine amidase family protein [Actinomycetaceae bacterium]
MAGVTELVWKKFVALIAAFMLVAGVGVTALSTPAQASSSLPGHWLCDADGECIFFDPDGEPYTNTWLFWYGNWYYLGSGGWMYRTVGEETFVYEIDDAWYMFGPSGAMRTGWYQPINNDEQLWMYSDANGNLVRSAWRSIGGKWYYFDHYAVMLASQTLDIDEKTYRFASSGAMITGWYQDGSSWYYYGADGAMYKEQWLQSGGTWYYFDAGGQMCAGDGQMPYLLGIGEDLYFFDSSGAMITGWYSQSSASDTWWYYFDPDGRHVQLAWRYIDGNWYYFGEAGIMFDSGGIGLPIDIGGSTYRFSPSGAMITGWYNTGETWNYHKANGAMAKSEWVRDAGKWYFFAHSGDMLANACTIWPDDIDSDRYCFAPDGAMVADSWFKDGDYWLYLGPSGAARSDWGYIGGKWYYFDPANQNRMVANQAFLVRGTYYVFDDSGAWTGESWTLDQ